MPSDPGPDPGHPDPGHPDPGSQEALIAAVRAGDVSGAGRAIGAGAQIDRPLREGDPPALVIAAGRGDGAMVDFLLARGAFALACVDFAEPRFAFAVALQRGDGEIARRIVSKIGHFDRGLYAAAVMALAQGPRDDEATFDMLGETCVEGPGLSHYDFDAILAAAAGRGHRRLVAGLLALGGKPAGVAEAARAGAPDLVRVLAQHGASINLEETLTGDTPLHAAVGAPGDAAGTVETLLRLGCRHNGRARDGKTPAERARALGRPELARLIDTLAPTCGPRWMQEARARGVNRYVFLLTRAFGLGFDLNDVERPILWEGDDAGFGWPMTAAEAITLWHRDMAPRREVREATAWFVPFMERLASGQDFGLDELERAAQWCRRE